jgi:hypothetical protein
VLIRGFLLYVGFALNVGVLSLLLLSNLMSCC